MDAMLGTGACGMAAVNFGSVPLLMFSDTPTSTRYRVTLNSSSDFAVQNHSREVGGPAAAAAAAAAAAWAWVVPSDLGGFPLVSAGQHQFMDGFAMGEPETVDVA